MANAEGGRTVGYTDTGEYIYFEPVSLKGIDQLTIRYAAGVDGGIVDVRQDAPDGPVVGTATLMPTGELDGLPERHDPDRPPTTAAAALYFTFRGAAGRADDRPVRPRRVHVRRQGRRVELGADGVGARPTRSPARPRWP